LINHAAYKLSRV